MTAEVKKRRFAEGTQVASPTDLSAGGGSGSGEKNYITNSSESTNWGESTSGQVDVSSTTTISELPREFTTEQGIKIVGTGSTGTDEYVYYRFSLDDVDMARKLKITFAQKPVSGYASGDLTVEMYYNSASNYGGAYTQVTVANGDITDVEGDALYTFDTDGTGIYYELRINKPLSATTPGIVISDVIVGPGKVIPGFASEDAVAITGSVSSLTTNIDNQGGFYWRRGDRLIADASLEFGGANTDAAVNWLAPNGLTIDTSKFYNGHTVNVDKLPVGTWSVIDESTGTTYDGPMLFDPSNGLIRLNYAGSTGSTLIVQPSANQPITFADGDAINVRFDVPILEWSGSASANFINDEVAAQNARFSATDAAGLVLSGSATVPFGTEDYNEGGGSYASGVYTVPADGKYKVDSSLGPDATTAGTTQINIKKNGTAIRRSKVDTTSTNQNLDVSAVIECVSGDTLEIAIGSQGFTTTGSSLDNFFQVTRVPDFTAGQAVSFGQASDGNYGLVSYKEEDLDPNGSGPFNAAGTVRIAKVNNVVTMSWDSLSHTSSASPATASGFIPAEYRPTLGNMLNCYSSTTSLILRVNISTAGVLQFNYADASHVASNRTDAPPGSVSWVI